MKAPDLRELIEPSASLPVWLRALSRLPWCVHYGVATCLAVLLHRVFRYRIEVVRANLAGALPTCSRSRLRHFERAFYRNLTDVIVEVVKSATITADELRDRVRLRNIGIVRRELMAGRCVIILAAHQCNWEWLQLALSLNLGYPVDTAYKPLRGAYGERLMRDIRSRFGSHLVPAKELLGDILKRRCTVRAIAMLADQVPATSPFRWWTHFLNRETAFYMGPEKIARAARYPVLFAGMRRVTRGRYEVYFEPIAATGESYEPGSLTEGYARLVEAQIVDDPAGWIWSHRRWKLQRAADCIRLSAPNRVAT